MPVVFGPFLRQVAERAPVPVRPPPRNDDSDEASAGDSGEVTDRDTDGSSGVRRLVLAGLAGGVALAVGGWLARRRGNGDADSDT